MKVALLVIACFMGLYAFKAVAALHVAKQTKEHTVCFNVKKANILDGYYCLQYMGEIQQ